MTSVIRLKSDFHDYYDHWFAGSWQKPDIEFSRNTTDGLLRPVMFQRMEAWGLKLPRHGIVKHLHPKLIAEAPVEEANLVKEWARTLCEVVVYTDTSAHAGEGKFKVSLSDALGNYPDHFASEHIPALANGCGQSLRYLRIGSRQFWLRYTSANDWRSNCGDVTIEVLCEEKPKTPAEQLLDKVNHPLFAVDFVRGRELYAVDFNIAPGLKGSGIEEHISSQEVYKEISDWLSQYKEVQ
ncbi:MAG: hypothetical protein CMK89_07675 [Pseudomonadales bacterium]|nr:hypothetical protein [Pseudomonadales bacterium]